MTNLSAESQFDRSFIALAAPLADRVGWPAVETIADSTLRIAGDHLPTYVGLMQLSVRLIDDLLLYVDRDAVLRLYRLAGRIGATHPDPALRMLKAGPGFVKELVQDHERDKIAALLDLVSGMSAERPLLAARLLESSPALLACLTMGELAHMGRCLQAAPVETQETAMRLLGMTPSVIYRLPKAERACINPLHALAAQTLTANTRLAEALYEQSPRFITSIGFPGMCEVVRLSVALGQAGWAAAQAFFVAGCDLVERIGYQGLEKTAGLGRIIAADCPQTAAVFVQRCVPVFDRIGVEGLWAFARFCADMAGTGSGMAVRFPEQSLGLMDRLLERGDPGMIRQVYDLAGRTGRINPMLAHKLLEKSPDLMDRIGFKGLEAFSRVVLNLARDSWTTADALIKVAPQIIDLMGYAHVEQMVAFSLKIARKNVYGAVGILEKTPSLLEQLLPLGGRTLSAEVFSLAEGMAETHWAVAVRLLERSPGIVAASDVAALTQIALGCRHIAAHDAPMCQALLDISAAVIEKTELATLLLLADFWGIVAPQMVGGRAAGMLSASLAQIDAWIALGGPEMPAKVYRVAFGVARINIEAGLNLLNHSLAHLEMAGFNGLSRIADQVRVLSEIDPHQAARFAAGEGIQFNDFAENIPKGLRLQAVKPILFNYLTALLGYRLEIEAGPRAAVHARKIVLPEKVLEFDDDHNNFIYYKVMATRLEAQLEYDGFDLKGAHPYALFEALRHQFSNDAPDTGNLLIDFPNLFPEPRLIEELMHILEYYRLERRLVSEYPALGDSIRMVNRHDSLKRPSAERVGNGKQRILEHLARSLMLDRWPTETPAPDHQILLQAREKVAALDDASATFENTLETAAALYVLIDAAFSEPFRPVSSSLKRVDPNAIRNEIGSFGQTARNLLDRLHHQEGQQQTGVAGVEAAGKASRERAAYARRAPQQTRVPHAINSGFGKRKAFESETEAEENRQARLSSDQQGVDGGSNAMTFSTENIEPLLRRLFREKGITPNAVDAQTRRMRPDQIGMFLNTAEAMKTAAVPLEAEARTRLYPEWDEARNGYRDDWARIREQPALSGDSAFYAQTVVRHAGLLKRVRREFQRLRPEAFARTNRRPDGEEIDLDAAIESVIDRKIGLSPSENLYQHTEKRMRDIAVAILVDMSKSTRGDTLQFEKEALVILSEALQVVGDAYAIYGFSGDNRDNVDFHRIKGFKEANSQAVRQRIAGIECGLENRDGAALRHVTGILKSRQEKTRLIILLSDGKPVDKAYAGRYAIEDTRKALMEAQRAGIKTFCITVDQKAPEYLPRMYRHSTWVVVDDVARLPEKIARIFSRLTR